MKKTILSGFIWCILPGIHPIYAQADSSWNMHPDLYISTFLDVYYVFDFNQPAGSSRQSFFYNHNRHNEFNLNEGILKAELVHPRYRMNLGFHAGTYVNDNYAAEPGFLKNVYEANAGLSIDKKSRLWLDFGILPSYIGFESAISIDNPTLTRSIAAENSPYFVSGAKVTYIPSKKWEFSAFVLNGWQRIQRISGNSLPSFGTQIRLSPKPGYLINWSTFAGTDDPDSTRRIRYFSNIYSQLQTGSHFVLTVGLDYGIQQNSKHSSSYNIWYSPALIAQWFIKSKWKTAIRGEYYQDDSGTIISAFVPEAFRVAGISWNLDYSPVPDISCRIETRLLKSTKPILNTAQTSDHNFFVAASIAVKFRSPVKQQQPE